jgi:hypothetical protein
MIKKIAAGLLLAAGFLAWNGLSPKVALAAQAHPAGTLVQSGGTVWQINEAGTGRLSFESAEKFYSNRLSFNYVVPANSADLALPVSSTMPWGDGVLFADHAIIYQVSGGQKHGFISANVFLGQGFEFGMVRDGSLAGLPEGQPVRSAGDRHLAGTLVRTSTGAVYLQTANGSQAFPSAAVFFSQGGKFTDVAPANSADNVSVNQIAAYRTGTLVNDGGAIWVTKGNTKFGFPTAACFLNFGFTFTVTLSGSTNGMSQAGTVCGDAPAGVPSTGAVSTYTTPTITTSQGSFAVKMETFNLASGKIRVLTDTAADRDCATDCPVTSLGAYVSANGGQAGMNGTYLCPAAYPECAGKTNSFFWKVIDSKLGKVINANNGLGDGDPFITFDSLGQAKYFHRFLDYKDSGFNAAAGINSASIIENGTITLNYAKLDDKQRSTKSTQGAMALKGQTLYLIHVMNATVPDQALVLQALGVDHAILLDGGGSTAMMYDNAYKSGPGRNIPNAVIVQILP